jgi:hypothetical protein
MAQVSLQIGKSAATFYLHEIDFTRRRPFRKNLSLIGEILEIENEKLLTFSFYSSMEGYADLPENYSVVSYTINGLEDKSFKLDYRRTNIPVEVEKTNQEKFMPGMMSQIKVLAER